MKYRELLLGCGSKRKRELDPYVYKSPNTSGSDLTVDNADRWKHVTTVDVNPKCNPHYVMDLERGLKTNIRPYAEDVEIFKSYGGVYFELRPDSFDEVHAYEVLEHLGEQGNAVKFFGDFDNIWEVLKPGGWLCATVPSRYSVWFWGDPGHRRVILPATLQFLNRPTYDVQVGPTAMSDYRGLFFGDWDVIHTYDNEYIHSFVLQAVKPARHAP